MEILRSPCVPNCQGVVISFTVICVFVVVVLFLICTVCICCYFFRCKAICCVHSVQPRLHIKSFLVNRQAFFILHSIPIPISCVNRKKIQFNPPCFMKKFQRSNMNSLHLIAPNFSMRKILPNILCVVSGKVARETLSNMNNHMQWLHLSS